MSSADAFEANGEQIVLETTKKKRMTLSLPPRIDPLGLQVIPVVASPVNWALAGLVECGFFPRLVAWGRW